MKEAFNPSFCRQEQLSTDDDADFNDADEPEARIVNVVTVKTRGIPRDFNSSSIARYNIIQSRMSTVLKR